MTATELRWALPIMEVFMVPGWPVPDFRATLSQLLRQSAPLARLGLRFALLFVTLSPLVFRVGSARRSVFGHLNREERARHMDHLLAHRSMPVRELTLLVKFSACVGVFGQVDVLRLAGFDGPSPYFPGSGKAPGEVSLHVLPGDHPHDEVA